MTSVILASSSPSRLNILRAAGITPQVIRPEVDEQAVAAAAAPRTVADQTQLLAQAKGDAVLDMITAGACEPHTTDQRAVLLASDSILDLDGRAVGKPHTAQCTRQVWKTMGGRTGTLYTGHLVAVLEYAAVHMDRPAANRTDTGTWRVTSRSCAVRGTQVTLAELDDAEIDTYIATGEPLEVAGALTIDGYGGAFVESLTGDHLNVLGLSLPLVRSLLREQDVAWHELWDTPGA